jgi:oligosaccharide 4-alpha-D-glucosyltransferase
MMHYLGSAARIHNIYSLLWAKMLYEKIREIYPDKRLFNLIRSGYAGMQKYSTFPWSGDVQRSFSGLRAQLPIMLGMGLSGVGFILSDIGGFVGGEIDPELYIRWIQYGTFSPVMRPHGMGVPTEPIYYDSLTEAIATDYIRLRYQLLPYNYTLAWLYSHHGMPLARPLVMIAPDDPLASEMDDEYFWGSAFLVAPVMERGANSRTVYLPNGKWIDYWTEDVYSGEAWVTVDTPLERIPLFVKAGSFIPMVPQIETTKDYRSDTLIIHYYPNLNAQASVFSMYEDDGKTPDAYDLGEYEIISFEGNAPGSGYIQITYDKYSGGYPSEPPSREMIFSIHKILTGPDTVELNDTSIQIVSSLEMFYSKDTAAYWDENEKRLWVHYNWKGSMNSLTITGENILEISPTSTYFPSTVYLEQPYPNPFNSTTIIRYSIPVNGEYVIKIFNLLGREIKILKKGFHMSGRHSVNWDGTTERGEDVSSGIYFVVLSGKKDFKVRKVLLVR